MPIATGKQRFFGFSLIYCNKLTRCLLVFVCCCKGFYNKAGAKVSKGCHLTN